MPVVPVVSVPVVPVVSVPVVSVPWCRSRSCRAGVALELDVSGAILAACRDTKRGAASEGRRERNRGCLPQHVH